MTCGSANVWFRMYSPTLVSMLQRDSRFYTRYRSFVRLPPLRGKRSTWKAWRSADNIRYVTVLTATAVTMQMKQNATNLQGCIENKSQSLAVETHAATAAVKVSRFQIALI